MSQAYTQMRTCDVQGLLCTLAVTYNVHLPKPGMFIC